MAPVRGGNRSRRLRVESVITILPFRVRFSLAAVLLGLGLGFPSALVAAEGDAEAEERRAAVLKTFQNEITPFLKTYCTECHGDKRSKQGGVSFVSTFRRPGAGEFRKQWQLALVNVKEHVMPPEDAKKQPTDDEREKFMAWIPNVKYLNPKDPGTFVIRRLTKIEYGNTLHDLLGVEPSIAKNLPDEVPGEGYLNTISPLQTEQYLAIANEALDKALGSQDGPPTPLQKQLFGATPPAEDQWREAAKKVARSLARRAYRRPATEAEIEVLLRVFDLARENKLDYSASLRLMLKAVLVSPQFLYITPASEPPAEQKIVPLDDYQLASRLSYFLWATMPDAELAALAERGKLSDPSVLRAQVKRMLQDPRSRALFDGFGAQWLGVTDLREKRFDPMKFPEITPALKTAMYDEVRMFFESIVRENRSILTFITGDYTFVDENLAAIYGLEKEIVGPQMRRVQLTHAERGGILCMPGILATTSFPERTSAVKRGAWVLEQVLGEHVPAPPANVPALEKQDQKKVANLTLRQRTELHRKNAVCANCHKVMDPIGFGLENFDAIGRWRNKDESGRPIDSAGELPGGEKFDSPSELKAIIAARRVDIVRNLAEKMLAYALCRQLEGYDEIVVEGLLENIRTGDFRMQSLITELVVSYPFTHRRIE
jgi:hypothetical protein